jgi:hypothetical protein
VTRHHRRSLRTGTVFKRMLDNPKSSYVCMCRGKVISQRLNCCSVPSAAGSCACPHLRVGFDASLTREADTNYE